MRFLLFSILFISAIASSFSQSEALAKNYFEQGDYEKALVIYQERYEKLPENLNNLLGLTHTLQELGYYKKAIAVFNENASLLQKFPHLQVELGYTHQLAKQEQSAHAHYQKALNSIVEHPYYAFSVGGAFQKYNLLSYAAQAFEKANEIRSSANFNIQLARIYGEQGKVEKMFVNYLELIQKNPPLRFRLFRIFRQYITEDPNNSANKIFRKVLIKKMHQKPNPLYNNLLSWLFIQQKDFEKAFLQEKAVFLRTQKGLHALFDLAEISYKAEKYKTTKRILTYLIEKSRTLDEKLKAHALFMSLRMATAKRKEYPLVQREFEVLFSKFGTTAATIALQQKAAHFYAFYQGRKAEATHLLKTSLTENLNQFQRAKTKLELADILVLDEQFNSALIYYSQVQTNLKNDLLAQKARFKVAKTSYYKGDFDWALTQLDVLKASTSQRIANDALALSLLIKDNILEDSTQTALLLFAQADLCVFQEKGDAALLILNKILKNHPAEKIVDDALLRKARLLVKKEKFEQAAEVYQKITAGHQNSILIDNAYFELAELYQKHLNLPKKAKHYYGEILFNHQDSIFFVEASKNFRNLRKMLSTSNLK